MQSAKKIFSEELISQYGHYYEVVSPPNRYMSSEHDAEWYHGAPHSVYIQEHLGGLKRDTNHSKRNYEDAVLAFDYFVQDELQKTLASMLRNERSLDGYYCKLLKKLGLLSHEKSMAVDRIQARLKEVKDAIGKNYPPIVKGLKEHLVLPSEFPKVGETYYAVDTDLSSKLQINKLTVINSSINNIKHFDFSGLRQKGNRKYEEYDYWFHIFFEDSKGNKIRLPDESLFFYNGHYYLDPYKNTFYFKSNEEAKSFLLNHIQIKQNEIDEFLKED